MRWIVWLGVVGCYAPQVPSGAPCDPAIDNCPSGQTCVAEAGGHVCSSAPSIDAMAGDPDAIGVDGAVPGDGPPGDGDGDGIPDALDNCVAKANPSQANEDGDAFGDACDPCPPFTNNTDGDGDGVGDLCDPHPSTPGDSIVLFEGFADGIPASWVNQGWTASGGDAAIVSANGTVAYLGPMLTPSAHGTVSTAFVPTTLFGIGGHGFGVTNPSASATGSSGLVCEILTSAAQVPQEGIVDLSTSTPAATMSMTWAVGDEMVVSFGRTDTMYGCLVTDLTTPSSAPTTTNGTYTVTVPTIAIRSRSLSGRAHWLMYVTSP